MRRVLWAAGAGIAGGVSALAMAPYFMWWLLLLTLPVLAVAIDRSILEDAPWHKRLRAAFWPGWAFGFGFLALSLGWIGNALLVDAERYGWLLPFAKFGLPLGLALFYGIGAALAGLLWSRQAAGFALAFGVGLSEWLRGFALTGFPWNTLAQSLADTLVLMQGFAIVGPNGMTVLLVLAAASLAGLTQRGGLKLWVVIPGVVIFGALGVYGSVRLTSLVENAEAVVRIVQPNVAQKDKWQAQNRMSITRSLLDLTAVDAKGDVPAIVVWPEAATPYYLQDSPTVLAAIGMKLQPGQVLVSGTPRHGPISADGSAETYNGMLVVDSAGNIVESYDKHHLVPFGEYVPLRSLASKLGLEAIVDGPSGFSEGAGPRTLTLPQGLPSISPLVCYEVIFPNAVLNAKVRPALLVNVTNDAWYGDSAGPPQHLAQARLRAVEQGLPLARAANTGISALIDPYGRLVSSLSLNRQGAIEAALPKPLMPTLYARLGEMLFFLLIVSCLSIAVYFRKK